MSTFAERTNVFVAKTGVCVSTTSFGMESVVSISGSIAGGYMYAGNRALAEVHAAMLTEGTKRTTKEKLQESFDAMGTTVSFAVSADRLEFSAKVRRVHLVATLARIVEMLTEPSFPSKELTILKGRTLGALALEAENTKVQSAIALSHLLYEAGHPHCIPNTADTKRAVAAITVSQLRNHHRRTVFASTVIIALAGAVEESDCKKIARLFARLPAGAPDPLIYPVSAESKPGAAIAYLPAKESVDYQLGVRAAVGKEHADYAPLLLAVNILGRPGFSGRLMQRVREEQGLTYGTHAFLKGLSKRIDGHIAIWATFAPSLFVRGRLSVRAEIARLQKEGPSLKEFQMHRDLFISNWYVRLAQTDAIADAIHDTLVEGDGPEYLDLLPEKIEHVSYEAVVRACRTYFRLPTMAETAAGTLDPATAFTT